MVGEFYKKLILGMSMLILLGIMQACGGSFLGSKPPTLSRSANLDSLAGRGAEFSRVILAISNLDPATRLEKAAAILVASQISTMKGQSDKTAPDGGDKVSGTCLLIYSGSEGLSGIKAFKSEDFALSDDDNVAYTAKSNFAPSECQVAFSDAVKDMPSASLDKWHVSFYQTAY